jgi:hypothetical protein
MIEVWKDSREKGLLLPNRSPFEMDWIVGRLEQVMKIVQIHKALLCSGKRTRLHRTSSVS